MIKIYARMRSANACLIAKGDKGLTEKVGK